MVNIINKNVNTNKVNYKFFPKDKDELQQLIVMQIDKYGNDVNLNNIDTSKITDMSNLFYKPDFTGNISNWNVSNVIDMSYMFWYSNFNGDISKWDVSNVKNMSHCFSDSGFNQDISNWDVGNVVDMNSMFVWAKFNQDIRNWNISNVIDMNLMFFKSKFNKDISNWFTKLNKKCKLSGFIRNTNINITSYTDFKQYHRRMILSNF